ncbi:MAG TPA: hypothetical protein OIM28_04180 [Clostridiaceae bacterium]|nr:hypothetical protein [Clostridiaceae bacterium]
MGSTRRIKRNIISPQYTIVESMQAAVEKIPIKEAFDELDNERDYYQEKRKETNDKLISRKGLIGKIVGFSPMVLLICWLFNYTISCNRIT